MLAQVNDTPMIGCGSCNGSGLVKLSGQSLDCFNAVKRLKRAKAEAVFIQCNRHAFPKQSMASVCKRLERLVDHGLLKRRLPKGKRQGYVYEVWE